MITKQPFSNIDTVQFAQFEQGFHAQLLSLTAEKFLCLKLQKQVFNLQSPKEVKTKYK